MDNWLFALPRLIAFILVMLLLLALGPIGWIVAVIYAGALFKN